MDDQEMNNFFFQKDINGIEGLCIVEPSISKSSQGYMIETYNRDAFFQEGLRKEFIQDNEVKSSRGVLRGMHVNMRHPQGKLIRVISGEIYDVVIDLRLKSPTFKQWFGIYLSEANKKQLYIPEGMGHGYLAMIDSIVLFKVSTNYIPNDEISFSWKSKELKIPWPIKNICVIQNAKDRYSRDLSDIQL